MDNVASDQRSPLLWRGAAFLVEDLEAQALRLADLLLGGRKPDFELSESSKRRRQAAQVANDAARFDEAGGR